MEERRIQLAVEVDSTRSRTGFNEVVQQAESTSNAVERAGARAGRAVGGIGNAATTAAGQVGTAERSLIGSIQRATAALEAGERGSSRFYESLAGRRGVDARALEPYLAQLRQVEAQQNRVGVSAGQIRQAMSTVPAQLTDIVTSLQGGQNPLTVLLQQGGQLRDQFGSTGAAARAMGGYVVGLVNPFTVAAAAVAGLAAAHYAGAAEAEKYGRALALSGNMAGATVEQMADAADAIGKIEGSQREAAQAVAALAGSGQVAASSLERYGAIAIGVQHDIGRSVESTVEDFAELGRSPVAALDKLNEKYHFVTYATYAQVKALMDQGRASEAARIAQDAYADAMVKQREKVAGTLSDWERGWHRIKSAVSGATDAVIDLAMGREKTYNQQIKGLLGEREFLERNLTVAVRRGDEERQRVFEAELERNKKEINAIRDKQKAQKDAAKAEADAQEKDDAKKKWLDEGDKRLSRPQQLKRDLEQARNLGNKAFEGEDPVAAEREIQARLSLIRKDYSDIFNGGIDAQIAGIKRRGEIDELVQKRSGDALAAHHAAGLVREEDYIAAVAALDDAALTKEKERLQEVLRLTAGKANSQKEQSDLRGQIAELDEKRISRQLQLTDELMQLEVKRSRAAAENYANVLDKVSDEGDALTKQLQAQRDSNEQIGLSAQAIAELEAVRLEAQAARKEENADIADGLDLSGRMSDEYRAQAKTLRDLAQAKRDGATKQGGLDLTQATEYLKIVEAIDEQTKRAATGMSASFGKVGSAIGSLTTALSGYARAQAAISAQLADAMKKASGDPVQAAKAGAVAAQQTAQAQIKSYGDVSGAAKGFFKEHTAGYRAMEGAEKAFRAVEMAMAIEAMVRKLFAVESVTAATVAGEVAKTTAVTSGAAAQVAADTVKGTSAAAVAVANQATGEPYSAWVRMAAMAAAMAALGFAVSGGGKPDTTAQDRQKVQGTGSVLGDSTAKSDSIARALDLVAANSEIELSYTAGMLSALRNIENSLDGLGNVIVRTTGITGKLPAGTAGSAAEFGRSALGVAITGGVIGMTLDKLTGGLVGKLTGSVLGKVFGGKVTTQDVGITADKAALGNILAGGLQSYQYLDQKKDGGLFRSDKTYTDRIALGAEANAQFTKVLAGLASGVTEAGKLLGVGGDAFTHQLESFVVDLGKVSLKDLKGDELQQALESVFAKVGDDLAKSSIGGLEQFQAVGEGYFETLARIANDYASLDAILASTGTTFGVTGIASVAARERLIELTGGIDELASASSSFAENYLTEAERLAPVQKYVTEQLAAMGFASIDTRDKFKATVLGLASSGALATEAGAAQYAGLLDLADAFAKTHAASVDLTKSVQAVADEHKSLQDEYDELTMSAAQLRAKERAGIDASNLALFDSVSARQEQNRAEEEAAAILDLQAEMYEAMGDKAGAAAVLQKQHAAALADMTPALRAATEATWAAQAAEKARKESQAEAANILNLQAQMYEAIGDKAGAAAVLQKQHAAALVDMTPALRAATEATWAAQAAEKARKESQAEASSILNLQAQMYEAMGDKAGAAAALEKQHIAALEGMSPALAAANLKLWAAQAAGKEVDKAQRGLEKAYRAQSDAIKDTVKNLTTAIGSWKKFKDNLLLGDLSPLTPQQKYAEARKQFEKTLALARGGDATARDNLQSVEEAFLQASRVANASDANYQADFLRVQQATDEAINWAKSQVDIGQASLDALYDQVSVLIDIEGSVLSVSEAIKSLADVTATAAAGPVGNTSGDVVDLLYQTLLGRHGDKAGLAYWRNAMQSGVSISDVASGMTRSDEYAALHSSAPKAATTYTTPNYAAMGAAGTVPLVQEIKALRASNEQMAKELKQLRTDQQRQTGDLIRSNVDANSTNADAVSRSIDRAAQKAAYTERTKATLV